MSGYLIIHYVDRSHSIHVGEPSAKKFFLAIEAFEEAYSTLPGFLETELIVD